MVITSQAVDNKGGVLIQLCVSLRSSATLRLLLFHPTFTAETQRSAEIRREDFQSGEAATRKPTTFGAPVRSEVKHEIKICGRCR